ncbi:MAG: xylulose kinase [Deltaproteobacteria bacterium]|nr:xylulose kinase [Deltaproteobacteria bacterium]
MAEKGIVAGLDIGTTGVKVLIVDTGGRVLGSAYREYGCLFPHPGWMEQDVGAMWPQVCLALREAVAAAGIKPTALGSLGLSSQRGTFIPVDREIKPLMNSVVHSDMRAGAEVAWIKEEIGAARYTAITGSPPTAIWAYPKIKWLIDHQPALFDQVHLLLNGQEYFLRLLGSEDLTSDPASRTLDGLMEVDRLAWSEELCQLIGLPLDKLPPLGLPARQVGVVSAAAAQATGLAAGTPLVVGAGDQQCAAVGAGIIAEGMAEITIGTSMVMVAHLDSRKPDPAGQVLIGGSGLPGKWDMEGLYATAGSSLKWWRDTYGQPEKAAADSLGLDVYDLITLEAAQSPPGAKGYLYLPFLYGILTPRYHDFARGVSLGQSLFHGRQDMARGVLEGVTMGVKTSVTALEQVLGRPFEVLRLSGGGAKSPVWNQMQADIYGRRVETLAESECTALGAAILGAVGAGVFASVEEGVARMVHPSGHLEPDPGRAELYAESYAIFSEAVDLLINSGLYEKVAAFQSRHWG